MTARLINAITLISVAFAILVFIISYANFPDDVLIYMNSLGEPQVYITRDTLFYSLLAIAVIFNGAWMMARKVLLNSNKDFDNTIIGLGISQFLFNLFFATSIYFVNILNSRENFNYSNFGLFVYITGIALILSLIYTGLVRTVLKK